MATTGQQHHPGEFALRPVFDRDLPDGAWWPQSRSLSDQLKQLFALWPPDAGRINRILYSPPDWDDHPRMVAVAGRWVRTGSFPRDDTHLITVTMSDMQRRRIRVIPPDATPESAGEILDDVADPGEVAPASEHLGWENEGGHV